MSEREGFEREVSEREKPKREELERKASEREVSERTGNGPSPDDGAKIDDSRPKTCWFSPRFGTIHVWRP